MFRNFPIFHTLKYWIWIRFHYNVVSFRFRSIQLSLLFIIQIWFKLKSN